MDASLDRLLQTQLQALTAAQRLRRLRPMQIKDGRLVSADGRLLLDASSNDYLGLSQHPQVKTRAAEWAERYGAGAPASRLVTGTRDITLAVEERLAAFKQCEAALLFASGFQANATVIPVLAQLSDAVGNALGKGGETLIFSDELNHASIVHGCRVAKTRVLIFRHNDLNHLADLLQQHAGHGGRRLILTETVFSMDGDCADLAGLVPLAERHGALLYVDEAHATGVIGPQGRGLAAATGGVDVVMGTLGKAFGAFGAYVAGSRLLIDYLVNRCGGFIYTTALPPPVLGAVDAALDLVPGMDEDRARLSRNSQRLRDGLVAAGFDTLSSSTQIVPAIIGSEAAALAAAALLDAEGVLAVAIRPPTVPVGTSRLRFALSSRLDEAEMNHMLGAVAKLTAFAG